MNVPPVWRPIPVIALFVGRPARTLRTWAQRGHLTVACDVQTRALVVELTEAALLARSREDRAA